MIMEQRPTVLVTGSSGLIGTAVVKKLVERYHVVALDIVPPNQPLGGVTYIKCDLADEASVQDALGRVHHEFGGRIASVIHLAAYYDFSGADTEQYEQVTVRGTQRLLRRLKQFERVEQFIFSSTTQVYLPSEPSRSMSEEWPLNPKWAYPQSKVRSEQATLTEHGNVPCLILRIAGVYDDFGHALPLAHQVQRIAERWPTAHVFPGDPSHGQAMVHLDDVADAFAKAVERRNHLEDELVLLIGEPETISYGELQQRLARLIFGEQVGGKWRTYRIPRTVARAGAWFQRMASRGDGGFVRPWMMNIVDDHYELDIGRARRLLKWAPQHRLRDTLPDIIASYRAEPVRWYREHGLKMPEELQRRAAQEPVVVEPAQREGTQARK